MRKLLFSTFFMLLPAIASGDVYPSDHTEQKKAFEKFEYHYRSPIVPRIFMKSMPQEVKKLEGKARIALFVQTVLPLVLLENEKILEEREKALEVASKKEWDDQDLVFIKETAYKYRIIKKKEDPSTFDEKKKQRIKWKFDHKIRPIPPPIALGQAALESGWGTSRFVRLGNNIFGHVSYDPSKGIKPLRWSGKSRHIKIFDTLSESIAVYMLNLNRNRAYYSFRQFRRYNPGDYLKMAEGFVKYSRIKEEYTGRLQLIIKRFGFYRYGKAKFKEETFDETKIEKELQTESQEKPDQVNIN